MMLCDNQLVIICTHMNVIREDDNFVLVAEDFGYFFQWDALCLG